MNTRTVKTKGEVIEALNCCAKVGGCEECPYDGVSGCHMVSKHDAIHYLCEDSDDNKKATVAVISDEERRLRKAVIAQQQTINSLLGLD